MNTIPPVLYRGSVKNVRGVVSESSLLFEFSDRFSVFDWGEMPDQLEDKGVALAIMGKCFFKHFEQVDFWRKLPHSKVLEEKFDREMLQALFKTSLFNQFCETGLRHHALLNSEGDSWETPFMRVKNVEIHRPLKTPSAYDYSHYQTRPVNALVPLEVIFRLGLVPGNSLSKRLGDDQKAWKEFGFDEIPACGFLKKPFIDFSTKLERGDRYLSKMEAKTISGLSDEEYRDLNTMAELIALNLYLFHNELGLSLWDGKIEVAFFEDENNKRSFMLVDSVGIDELRLSYKEKSFSKEFLREIYKPTKWYQDLEASKLEASKNGGDFRSICLEKYHSEPEPLSKPIKMKAEAVYRSFANEVSKKVTGKTFFDSEFNLHSYSERYL